MKVLIVEDETLVAMHLEMIVGSLGHEVCAMARTAGEAIAHAGTHQPDVILMDVRLADGSSGLEAAREIHAHHGLRCIFLSANLDQTFFDEVAHLQPIAFIRKPFAPRLLAEALALVHPKLA